MTEGNILVIDDELVMCKLLKELLEDRNYLVEYSQLGKEGIEKFKQGNFHVVMTDLKMPDINGIEVLKEIKKFDEDSVIVVLTAYPSFETVQLTLRLGAYDYITKPFNIEDISFIIKRAVSFRNLILTNKELMMNLETQNLKLEEIVEKRTKVLSLLYKIGQDISSSLKLEEVLETIVDKICAILDLEICSILLIEEENNKLLIKAARGLDEEICAETEISLGESIPGWVVQHSEAVLVEDIESDPRFARKNKAKYYTRSFISVPLIFKQKVIGVINVNNKKSKGAFTRDDFDFIKGIANQAAIAVENARLYSSLEETYIGAVKALTLAIDAKDRYTKTHSEHVTEYAVAIGKEMGFTKDEIEELEQACQLHDLGKIGVHDYILTKPGSLTLEEWEEIKLHSLKSAEILRSLSFLSGVIELVEQHHERYDGKGYPYGIKGEDIKLGARIISVADSFDAMITDRPYRKAFSKDKAIEEIKTGSGTQFDSKVVEAFLKVLEEHAEIIKNQE
ncbi:MAG: response regulator [Candidatus Omnitrophica bacterium]|nr:response regulator [Candidatus Omnitrophota bacterium]